MIKLITLLLTIYLSSCQLHQRGIRNLVVPRQPLQITATFKQGDLILHQLSFQLQYSASQPSIQKPIDFALSLPLTDNITVLTCLYRLYPSGSRELLVQQTRNLTRFQKIKIKEEGEGMASSYDPMDEVQSLAHSRQAQQAESRYDMHIPEDFHIMLVYVNMPFPGQLQPTHRLQERREEGLRYYLPPLDLGQLYIPTTRSKQVAEGDNRVRVQVFMQSYEKYLMFYSIGHPQNFAKDLGPMAGLLQIKQDTMDELKQFMFENPPWLIVLYFVLSFAEIVLKIGTVKSQFAFWKNIDKNQGVSLKTLFFSLAADMILLLYLYEYDASKMILAFHVVDIAVTVWKLSRTYSVTFAARFPFLGLKASELYQKREKLDGNAVWYMNYLLVPLMAMYLVYALWRRNWTVVYVYRFCLQTAVAFIAIFGFILMTPQLYINYKLKSVDHLNWRGLVYRFVTTIIDDVFAFMVTMPALRRAMYFRDDVIFVGYLYQRYIYRVDYSRKTAFTADEEGPKQD